VSRVASPYSLNLLKLTSTSLFRSTRLLQPSLSGSARISVICTINPAHSAVTESQSTLNFAAGIKRVVLNAKQTEVVDPAALIQQYQNEIAELKVRPEWGDEDVPPAVLMCLLWDRRN
jgi:centromeric protein E